jgi:hypothetical protein
MRVTTQQIARLHAVRARDGITIQDHVRRALDEYLDRLDQLWSLRNPATNSNATAAHSNTPRVVQR